MIMKQDQDQVNQSSEKKNYYCSFQDSWREKDQYKNWLLKNDKVSAKCKICSVTFTIKHDGEKAVRAHSNSKKHKEMSKTVSSNQLLSNMFVKKGSNEEFEVAAAEVAQVYHGVCHHHSYLSMDCGIKLNSAIYCDSKLSTKIRCGRTKAESIVENVLLPKSIELVLKEMSNLPFSISNDASNKGNRKIFPIAVRYFHFEKGIQNKIIDFYEDSDETSLAISEKLKTCILNQNLSFQNLVSYTADNASVNYGKTNSVFQKLLVLNHKLIKSNCQCHVLHNAARNACKALSFDVENLACKVFAEFSNSAKRKEELKQCFEFMDMEYEEVLRHAPTRWLSLYKAVERLLLSWPAIKAYFLELGEENCNKVVWGFIKDQENAVADDLSSLTLPEAYLHFVHHFMYLMTQTLLKLESNIITVTEVDEIMRSLRNQLQNRVNDRFFGSKVNSALNNFKSSNFVKEALQVYTRAIDYLNKWYDFDNNVFQNFTIFNLKTEEFNFNDVLKAAKCINNEINEDVLFDEIHEIKRVLPDMLPLLSTLPVDKKWVKILSTQNEFREVPKIVSSILAIPVSNAFVEGLFSIMGNIWTNERNRLRLELIKGEICTKINFNMCCSDFLKFLNHKDQINLLKCAMGKNKYSFKNS